MGCVQTSTKPSEEEAIICAEEVLKFHLHSCTTLDLTLRKFSLNERLTPLQLTRAAKPLFLQICNTGPFNRITSTLNSIKDSEGNYKLVDLIIISVLLGKDPPDTKARILYHCFDQDLEGSLGKEKVQEMANSLVRLSVDTLGGLVSDGQSPYSSELKNCRYLADLNSVKKSAIIKLVDFIMIKNDKVDEVDFIERLVFYCEGRFLSSSGVREALSSASLAAIPQKSFATVTGPYKALKTQTPKD